MATIAELEIQIQQLQNSFTRLEQSLNKTKISELVSADSINDTDIIPMVQAGVTKRITRQTFLSGLNLHLAADKDYDTIQDRDADKANLTHGENVFVEDASGDPTVNHGWAIYRYDKPKDVFHKLSEQEGIDFSLTDYLKKSDNLAGLTDKAAARSNLDIFSTTEMNSKLTTIQNMIKVRTQAISGNTLISLTGQSDANYYVQIIEYVGTSGNRVWSGYQVTSQQQNSFNFVPPTRYSSGTLYYRIVNKD